MIRFKDKLVNSELTKELYVKLKNIWHLDDWALGVMHELKSDEQRLEILKMIDDGETNPNKIAIKALEFAGIVGTPIEEYDGDPADIINWDSCTEEEKRIILDRWEKRNK